MSRSPHARCCCRYLAVAGCASGKWWIKSSPTFPWTPPATPSSSSLSCSTWRRLSRESCTLPKVGLGVRLAVDTLGAVFWDAGVERLSAGVCLVHMVAHSRVLCYLADGFLKSRPIARPTCTILLVMVRPFMGTPRLAQDRQNRSYSRRWRFFCDGAY